MGEFLKNKGALVFGVLIWSFFLLGDLFPNTWWGTHYTHFSSPILRFGILGISLILILSNDSISTKLSGYSEKYFNLKQGGIFLISLIIGLIYYSFPMTQDFYGDAPNFMGSLSQIKGLDNTEILGHLFNFEIWNPKIGEKTTLSLAQLIANNYQPSGSFDALEGFRLIDAFFGSLYSYWWIKLTNTNIKDKRIQGSLIIAGVLTPMAPIFLGHQEIYAPVLATIVFFFYKLSTYNKNNSKANLVWLIISLVLCLKFHIANLVLLPVFLMSLFQNKIEEISADWGIKKVYIPLATLGIASYFFVFEDHKDERFLNGLLDYSERTFLPIFAPEAPLDRYTLFHYNHFLDLINQAFIWSPGILLILSLIIVNRKSINFSNLESNQAIVSTLSILSLFFLINPLLGMQMDWDLFCIPGVIIMCGTVFLLKDADLKINFTPAIIGLSLFAIPSFTVNLNKEQLSQRLIATGKSAFKGYWIRSVGTIKNGVKANNSNLDYVLNNLNEAAEYLEPYAIKGHDLEMARLHQKIGKLNRQFKKDYQEAKKHHETSASYYFENGTNLIGLMETYFILKDFNNAHNIALSLIKFNYPNKLKAHQIALHTALEAGLTREALEYNKILLKLEPQNELYKFINTKLKEGKDPKALAQNFRSK